MKKLISGLARVVTVVTATAFGLAGFPPAALAGLAAPQGVHLNLPTMAQPVIGDSVTNQIVLILQQAEERCDAVPIEYVVDCLRRGYQSAASEMSGRPDYNGARSAVNQAARELNKLVRDNEDKTKPKIRVAGRNLRAVKTENLADTLARARAIVEEAETKIIRSAGSSAKRKLHYTRIAQAVGSTKKILRSA